MKSFYKILYYTMKNENVKNAKEIINNHIKQKRLNINLYKKLLKESDYKRIRIVRSSFDINFVHSEAFWQYFFFRLNFVENWINIMPKNMQEKIIEKVNKYIDKEIFKKGSFSIKINCACINAIKNERKKSG